MSPLAREMLNQLLADYTNWAAHHPLAANTRRTYRTQIAQYCDYLTTLPLLYGDPLHDPHARDYAVRDYKVSLQTVEQRKPRRLTWHWRRLTISTGFWVTRAPTCAARRSPSTHRVV